VSTGNVLDFFNKLQLYWKAQHEDHKARVATIKSRPVHRVNKPFFAELIGQVYPQALFKIADQLRILSQMNGDVTLTVCTHGFNKAMGLPCYHMLYNRIQAGGILHIEDIHPHWHYNRTVLYENEYVDTAEFTDIDEEETPPGPAEPINDAPVFVPLEPAMVRGKGRPVGSRGHGKRHGTTSTARNQSGFEVVAESSRGNRGGRSGRGGRQQRDMGIGGYRTRSVAREATGTLSGGSTGVVTA
jgi:hypothetical protein